MTTNATTNAQDLAQALGLSGDDALFMQSVPSKLLAAIVLGQANLVAMAGEELMNRGLNTNTQWVGFNQPLAQQGSVDAFVVEEHERIEAFRQRWHQAHAINPGQFPLVMSPDNLGMWVEQLTVFDASAPFDLPASPAADQSRRRPRAG